MDALDRLFVVVQRDVVVAFIEILGTMRRRRSTKTKERDVDRGEGLLRLASIDCRLTRLQRIVTAKMNIEEGCCFVIPKKI